jgi:hypothetical protein
MNVSTIHKNAMGEVLQAISGASGVRIADDNGHFVELRYDNANAQWIVTTSNPYSFAISPDVSIDAGVSIILRAP